MDRNDDFLDRILSSRRAQVEQERSRVDFPAMRAAAIHQRQGTESFRFRRSLNASGLPRIIGEFKRASPSRGPIRADADVAETISRYAAAGVAAISVLTEPTFFSGSLADLRRAREVTALPILRKDFVVDESQIAEAAVAGADAVLLIVAALSDDELKRFRRFTEDDLGMDALVEVHSAEEMRRAGSTGAELIGVNNRDLKSFVTSLQTSRDLAALAPANATLVSESGISTSWQINELTSQGYSGFLIGESLMRADDPVAFVQELRRALNHV